MHALRAEVESLKAKADEAKAAVRNAGNGKSTVATTTSDDDDIARRAARMKSLKTTYNSTHKLWKEASAALERAERDGAENLDTQRQQVNALRERADAARAELNTLVEQAKAGIHASGSDLKSLKLEAARTESALRDKLRQLDDARHSADEERINVLYQERDMLKREAELAANALQSALREQGLSE